VIRDFLGQAPFLDEGVVESVKQDAEQLIVSVIVPELLLRQVDLEVLPVNPPVAELRLAGAIPEGQP
jgi:hypothetical protein